MPDAGALRRKIEAGSVGVPLNAAANQVATDVAVCDHLTGGRYLAGFGLGIGTGNGQRLATMPPLPVRPWHTAQVMLNLSRPRSSTAFVFGKGLVATNSPSFLP